MSNFRKLHISLTQESFQAVRKCAFDAESTISLVIDFLIEQYLIRKVPDGNSGDEVKAQQVPEVPAPTVPSAWSVSSIPRNG
jgi:hypothetical protein